MPDSRFVRIQKSIDSEAIWPCVRKIGERWRCPRDVVVSEQCDVARSVHAVESGLVKLTFESPDGHLATVAVKGRGSMLGVVQALLRRTYPVSCVSLTTSWLWRMPIGEFLEAVELDNEFGKAVRDAICADAHDQVVRSALLSCASAQQRLEHSLWQLSAEATATSEGVTFVDVSMKELAQMVAVTPEHLSRVLRVTEHQQKIRRHLGRLELLNRSALWSFPEDETNMWPNDR